MKQPENRSYEFTDDITQVSLWQYKRVIETGDVRYLLILNDYKQLPEYDVQELTSVWLSIYDEFSEIIGGNRSELHLMRHKQLAMNRHRYMVESHILSMIQRFPEDELIDLAKDFGYHISLDNFKPTFEKAYTRLMRLKSKIKKDEQQMAQRTDRPDIDGLITTLERFQGYQFNEKEMTLQKFANIYKAFTNDGKDRQK